MKKKISIALCCLLAGVLVLGAQTAAFAAPATGNENGFTWYLLGDGSVAITGYTGSDTQVSIPATVDGGSRTVTQIGEDNITGESGVFTGKNFTSVTIPEGITRLCGRSFLNCASLQSVSLPGTLLRIDYAAFEGCASLSSVVLPAGLTQIGEGTFRRSALSEITIPESVTYIGPEAFAGCAGLERATVFGTAVTFDENTSSPTYDKGIFSSSPMGGGIYGYSGSSAQTYALSRGIEFYLISSQGDLKDDETGVEITGSLPDGAALQVQLVAQDSDVYVQAQQSLGSSRMLVLYDLGLLIGANKVQPNENVTVTLPIPEEYQGISDLTVAYIDDNGNVTYINGTVADGKITFVTNHFSSYALVQKASASAGSVQLTAGTTTLYVGGRTTITPSVQGGVWEYDTSRVKLVQNENGSVEVTALQSGTTGIHYTVGWADGDITMTVSASELPRTGQDFLPFYILALLSAGTAGVVAFMRKSKSAD